MTPAIKSNLSQDEQAIDAIRRIAVQYKVSQRTARRYFTKRELPTPPEHRRLGGDGKSYSVDRPHNRSPLHTPLAIARSNIRRAERADRFSNRDIDVLRDIVRESGLLLDGWESVTRGIKPHLSQGGE